jgi:PAS domain S-box-containing protein
MVDAQGMFVHVSAAARQVFGYAPEELIGRRMIDLVLPEDRERTLQAAQRVMAGQTHLNFENRYRRKDGQVVHLLWSARWLPEAGLRVAVARDITERKRAEQVQSATYAISEAVHRVQDLGMLCQEVHQSIANLMPGHNLAVALHDDEGRTLSFPTGPTGGPGQFRAPGQPGGLLSPGDPAGRGAHGAPRRGPEAEAWVDPELQCRVGVPLSTPSGVIGALVLKSYGDETGCSEQDLALLQYICTQLATAIERLQLYGRLRHLSHHDALTGLPNRALLRDRLSLAMARARRGELSLGALPGPGPLQGSQRHPWPPGGRPPAAGLCRAAQGPAAGQRHGGPRGGRRVRRAAGVPRGWPATGPRPRRSARPLPPPSRWMAGCWPSSPAWAWPTSPPTARKRASC